MPNGMESARETPDEVAARVAEQFGLSAALPDPDVAGFGRALAHAATALAAKPIEVTEASSHFAARLVRISFAAMARTLGVARPPTCELDPRDSRFSDPAWSDNVAFHSLRQCFLALTQLAQELIAQADLDPVTEQKTRLMVGLMLDAAAPTNFLLTNPAALKRALDTGGASLMAGAKTFVDDVVHHKGQPRQVDASSFTVGENLAATPCKVVYRNELIELLQYEPQSKRVHAAPILCSPPWINKYYIMDLAPDRSFIEWALKHNRTVFVISYLNPGPEMAGLTMDDYLAKGPLQALDVITEITGAGKVDLVGLCLGGALAAVTDAYLSQQGDTRIGSLTMLNTLLDYSEPGVLGVFTDTGTVDRLEKQIAKKGYLDGDAMAATFNVLRANGLIFNYVVSNWLMGEQPPAFDLLAWNEDSTRMPAAMHIAYLRSYYIENQLARGVFQICGQQIELTNITSDCYVVSAANDHIVPWRSAYATTQLVSGPARFVLSSGGHIAGIVNPPSPKGWYLSGDDEASEPQRWRDSATKQAGSWWEDWTRWSGARAGPLIAPPDTGSERFPVLAPGPGYYVRAR